MKSKLSTAKKSKTTTFSRVFHPKKIDNFLGKLKLNFWTKNEDFEQCVFGKLVQKSTVLDFFFKNATFLRGKPIGLSEIGRQGSRKELSKSYPFSEWYNALRSLNAERKAVLEGGIKTKIYIPTKLTKL